MTLIDIKNLNTTEIKQVKEWCEKELDKLENQIVNLRERIAELEKDFTYLYKHHVEKNDG